LKVKTFSAIVIFFIFSLTLVIVLINFKKNYKNENQNIQKDNKNYDFLVYNTNPDFKDSFDKISEEYKNVSGIVPAFVTKNSDLLYDFDSKNFPDIFMIKNFDELKSQKQYGNVFDFLNASEKTFQEVAMSIPEKLRLKISDINNCGIPLTIKSCGIIIDPKVISSIFSDDVHKSVINDLRTCSYEDFGNFTKIKKLSSIKINDREYEVNNDFSNNLEATFLFHTEISFAKLLNNILSSLFDSAFDLSNQYDISKMSGYFVNWIQALDLISSNTPYGRGKDLVDLNVNSKKSAIKKFTEGKHIFLIGEDNDFYEIKEIDQAVASRLTFIPFKTPNTINSKLTIYCPYYFLINAKSEKKKMAQDFLTWLITSSTAQKHLIEKMNFVSYNLRDVGVLENSLSRSTFMYLQSDSVFFPVFQGAKKNWNNLVSKRLIDNYLSAKTWTENDYKNFDSYCIRRWTYN